MSIFCQVQVLLARLKGLTERSLLTSSLHAAWTIGLLPSVQPVALGGHGRTSVKINRYQNVWLTSAACLSFPDDLSERKKKKKTLPFHRCVRLTWSCCIRVEPLFSCCTALTWLAADLLLSHMEQSELWLLSVSVSSHPLRVVHAFIHSFIQD